MFYFTEPTRKAAQKGTLHTNIAFITQNGLGSRASLRDKRPSGLHSILNRHRAWSTRIGFNAHESAPTNR